MALHRIRNDEATASRVIIAASEIVQASFLIEYIPTIPERLDRTQRAGQRTSLADHLTKSIVSVGYHFGTVAVNQANDIALQVVSPGAAIARQNVYPARRERQLIRLPLPAARPFDMISA